MPPSVACVKVAHQLTWTSCQSSWKSSNTPKWLTPSCVQWDCEAQIYFHSEWLDFDSASPNDGHYLTTWGSMTMYQTHALRQSNSFFEAPCHEEVNLVEWNATSRSPVEKLVRVEVLKIVLQVPEIFCIMFTFVILFILYNFIQTRTSLCLHLAGLISSYKRLIVLTHSREQPWAPCAGQRLFQHESHVPLPGEASLERFSNCRMEAATRRLEFVLMWFSRTSNK